MRKLLWLAVLAAVFAGCESPEAKLNRLNTEAAGARLGALRAQQRLDSVYPNWQERAAQPGLLEKVAAHPLSDSLTKAEAERDLAERELAKFKAGH